MVVLALWLTRILFVLLIGVGVLLAGALSSALGLIVSGGNDRSHSYLLGVTVGITLFGAGLGYLAYLALAAGWVR